MAGLVWAAPNASTSESFKRAKLPPGSCLTLRAPDFKN